MPACSGVPMAAKATTITRGNHFFISLTPRHLQLVFRIKNGHILRSHGRGNLIHIAYALRDSYGRQNVLLWKHGIGFTV